jgi:hypothetical protein
MSARLLIAATLVGATLGVASAQAPANPEPKTTAEFARGIANTIRATTHLAPGSPITLAEATSHDNVVEIRFVVTDAAAFARFKANAERQDFLLLP